MAKKRTFFFLAHLGGQSEHKCRLIFNHIIKGFIIYSFSSGSILIRFPSLQLNVKRAIKEQETLTKDYFDDSNLC